jgi:hypothetical protein
VGAPDAGPGAVDGLTFMTPHTLSRIDRMALTKFIGDLSFLFFFRQENDAGHAPQGASQWTGMLVSAFLSKSVKYLRSQQREAVEMW